MELCAVVDLFYAGGGWTLDHIEDLWRNQFVQHMIWVEEVWDIG